MLKFSIIIPAYNVCQYLADCLDSVLYQDVDNSIFEVIVVDDCSPYGEKEIVDTYLSRYDNVRYIRHDVNKRQGGARNTGIRAARGEFVMFLDADDCIKYQNTFSILLKCVEENNPVVLRSNFLDTFSNNSSYQQIKGTYLSDVSCKSVDFMKWRMSSMFSCSSCATLYKKTFLLNNNLFFRENVLFEDTDWVQKTMYYAKSIDVIDFTFYAYRQSLDSTTRGYSIASFDGNVEGVIETYKFYKDKIDWNDGFGRELQNNFANNVVGLLKTGRHYSIFKTLRVLHRLNIEDITTLKGFDIKKNVVVGLVRYIPIIPVSIVRISYLVKSIIRNYESIFN